MAYLQVDVVSAEEQLFGGEAKFVALPGELANWHLARAYPADFADPPGHGEDRCS